MLNLKRTLLLLVTCATLAIAAPQAEAQLPFGWGFNNGMLPRNGYNDMAIPYFSQFPPVYYSHPVPRPYGWSPYAYPADVLTPAFVVDGEPAVIVNPYVEPKSNEKTKPDQPEKPQPEENRSASTPTPKVIFNPYYGAERVAARQD